MAKTRQVMKLNVLGADFRCTFTPERTNPFRLYGVSRIPSPYGWKESRKMIAEYANFESVLYHLLEMKCPEFKVDCFRDSTRRV